MKTFLKDFFNSDKCEYNHFKMPSKEKAIAEQDRKAVLEEIKKRLKNEDLNLLDKYNEYCLIVNSEDEYYAFICGVRMTLKVLAEIFCTE